MKLVRFLLFPFAVLYDLITSIRNLFYNTGIFKQTSFKTPVIVVGNLSVGGTGKTPQIEYLIRLLKDKFKVSVLSRGYKRKTNGFVVLNKNHSAKDVGDEPLQYFKKFNSIDVAVDANRVNGITKLINLKSPDVLLLDDAFQHRKVKGSFYILLTKFNDLFTNDFLLPTGNLRESRRGAKRSDVILVTKCPINLNKNQQIKIKNQFKKFNKEVFFTTISYADILKGKKKILIEDLKKYKILLVTGIANPNPLLEYLKNKNLKFKHLNYPDHHNFSKSDIQKIESNFNKLDSDNKIILTTEKDFIRLEDKLNEVSFLEIETKFIGEKRKEFDDLINSHILKNRH